MLSRSTYRRWTYLIVGGALFVPYVLFAAVLVPSVIPFASTPARAFAIGGLLALAALVASSFIPAVRALEGTAVRELLDDPVPDAMFGGTTSWLVRWRSSAMFVAHVLVGTLVSLASLVLPALLAMSVSAPFTGTLPLGIDGPTPVPRGWAGAWLPATALLLNVLLFPAVYGVGALLRRAATVLLGLPPAERIAQLERRAEQLAERNRLARELHDSVGHALSVVTLQAGAARRVLRRDLDTAEQALLAIEDAARAALDDLDYVLGLLRDGAATRAPQAGLGELPALLSATRLAGVAVDSEVRGDLAAIAPVVSREAYRILQECLTNVIRHAGRVPVTVRVYVERGDLVLTVRSPRGAAGLEHRRGLAAGDDGPRRDGGGSGLRGIDERAELLGGRMTAGWDGQDWEVAVWLPTGTRESVS